MFDKRFKSAILRHTSDIQTFGARIDMNPSKLDRRPLYAQAHDWLLALVHAGELQPGDRLPSEAQLAERLGISRSTLREALHLLEENGVIVRRQGLGTFVAGDHHLESGLERLESVVALAARQGIKAKIRGLSVETVVADEMMAERLKVKPGVPLTCVRRVVLVRGQAVAYMEDTVPARWLAVDDIEVFAGSVLDLLRRRRTPRVQQALAAITAVTADDVLARQLEVSPGAALLLLEETLFDADGTPLGFSRNYFVPDRFSFHVLRR